VAAFHYISILADLALKCRAMPKLCITKSANTARWDPPCAGMLIKANRKLDLQGKSTIRARKYRNIDVEQVSLLTMILLLHM
jgi:hypothetical protein